MSTSGPITHVSDTARWVALYRAMESERPDALFRDPYARRLAGERGERIVASMRRGRAMAWPMIVRTAVLDELILRAIERDGVDTVLNLAAGLDTRPYRLPLPSSLRWVEADFPAGSAPFQFAPAEGSRFFQAQGWQEAEFRSMWEESLRLKRTMRLAWLWNLVGRLYPKAKQEEFRRMSGIVLLRRA